ncbi:MAG: orotate phosphoribosyltransferase [Xanthomonadales bacterium]|nr:orotate phosphoribosyltransferase [Xanthomonadales bacterium]
MKEWTREFIELARSAGALKLGRFELKSGRMSPYFFNAGAFCDGRHIASVADCYADAIVAAMTDSGLEFDLVFGPAYKGIPLATSVAISLYRRHGINVPVAYDRKEAKDHGEGGRLVGAPVAGKVLVVDDVISAGTAFTAASRLIEQAGARVSALVVGLDRQERGTGDGSARSDIERTGVSVVAVASLDDLITTLEGDGSDSGPKAGPESLSDMLEYRTRYGA